MRLRKTIAAGLFMTVGFVGCGTELSESATSALLAETGASSSESRTTSDMGTLGAALRNRLQSFGVAPEVQDRLVDKFLAGGALDADTDATPVSSDTRTADGFETTRNIYADGSIALSRHELPNSETVGDVPPPSITGCSSRVDSFGTHIYSNCKVAWDAASWSVSWTADYDYNVNGEAITSAKSVHFGGIGDFSGAGTEIVTLRADRNGTAIADGYVNQKVGLGPTGFTRRVGVRLQVATRWTDRKAKESPFNT